MLAIAEVKLCFLFPFVKADLFTTGTERHPLYLEAAVEFLRLALLHEEVRQAANSYAFILNIRIIKIR